MMARVRYTFSKLSIQTTAEKEPLYEQNTGGCYNGIQQEGVSLKF